MISIKGLFQDVLPLIKDAAPTVAGVIGGPVGLATGYILPILADAFQTHPQNFKELVDNITHSENAKSILQDVELKHAPWLNTLLTETHHISSAEINIKLEFNDFDPKN